MNHLNDLISQRNALDAEINRIAQEAADLYEDDLHRLLHAVEQWAKERGDGWGSKTRKNWVYVTACEIKIGFGFDESPDYPRPNTPITVEDLSDAGYSRIDFDSIPGKKTMIGLLDGILADRNTK